MGADIKLTLDGLKRISSVEVRKDNHHYIVLSQLHDWVIHRALPIAKGVLVDYGCGGQPYRAIFEQHVDEYLGADVASAHNVKLDIEFRPGERLPLADGSVDTILATQTLEHVYDFDFYLRDCFRLLTPDGYLILTAPMQWRQHETPYDYWRYTRFGISRKLEEIGFHIADLAPCGGVYSLIGQIYLSHLAETGRANGLWTRCINHLALWLDRKVVDHDETLLWMCIARKNSAAS